jgi:hypothetical protein
VDFKKGVIYHAIECYSAIKRNEVLISVIYGEPHRHYGKWKKPEQKGIHYLTLLYVLSRIGKSIKAEHIWLVAQGWTD